MDEVPRISALLTEEAHAGLTAWCAARDVKVSGFLEALGQMMAERVPLDMDEAVTRGRIIDAERRSRE